MMDIYNEKRSALIAEPRKWLITGVAGFIGSNLLEHLLSLGQTVIGLDDLSTGYRSNLEEVQAQVSSEQWQNFRFIEGDIRSIEQCREACADVDYVLHHAALGSVPHSVADPLDSNAVNVVGFLNMLVAARDANVKKFVYAASSATYGDHQGLPKNEPEIGRQLSPYGVTKYVNELYADVFAISYGFQSVGLRYFNIFGRRQDPNGAYAAVIPTWAASMIRGEDIFINGDGLTSRDFCFVENVIQANILAALAPQEFSTPQIYNIAFGGCTDLNQLFDCLKVNLAEQGIIYDKSPVYRAFRAGDVRHSQASIKKATEFLGYAPRFDFETGLKMALPWYIQNARV